MFTAATNVLARSLNRAVQENSRRSRRTVLEYTDPQLRRERLHSKISEARTLRREKDAFARRHIQSSPDIEVKPRRRLPPSPRYGSGARSPWKKSELRRHEALSRGMILSNLIAHDKLRRIGSQVSARTAPVPGIHH